MAQTQESNIEFGKRFNEEWSNLSEQEITLINKKDRRKEKKAARQKREKDREEAIVKLQSQVRRQQNKIRRLEREAKYPVAQRFDTVPTAQNAAVQPAPRLPVAKILPDEDLPTLKAVKTPEDSELTVMQGLAQGANNIQKTAEAGLYAVGGFAAAGPVGALAGYGIGRYGPSVAGVMGGDTVKGAAKLGALATAAYFVPPAMPLALGLGGYTLVKGGINKLRGTYGKGRAA